MSPTDTRRLVEASIASNLAIGRPRSVTTTAGLQQGKFRMGAQCSERHRRAPSAPYVSLLKAKPIAMKPYTASAPVADAKLIPTAMPYTGIAMAACAVWRSTLD